MLLLMLPVADRRPPSLLGLLSSSLLLLPPRGMLPNSFQQVADDSDTIRYDRIGTLFLLVSSSSWFGRRPPSATLSRQGMQATSKVS